MKEYLKQGLSAALALTLCAGLMSGCGDKNTNDPESTNDPNNPGGQDEYVYVAETVPVRGSFTETFYNASYSGGYYYVSSNEQTKVLLPVSEDMEPGEDDGEVIAFGVTEDGAAAEDAAEDEIPEGYYESWEYKPVLYKIGIDGSCEKISVAAEETEKEEGVDSSSWVQSIRTGPDGTVYILYEDYRSWNDAPESVEQYSEEWYEYYHYEEKYLIRAIGPDGAELRTIDLSGLSQNGEEYFYVNGFLVSGDGKIYLTSEQTLYVLDAEGNVQATIEADSWMNNLYELPDGRVACMVYAERGYVLSVVDVAAGSFGEKIALPTGAYQLFSGGGDYDFYYTNGSNFYGFKLDSAEKEENNGAVEPVKLLNWINCDVDTSEARNITVLEDGRIACLSSQYGGSGGVMYARSSVAVATPKEDEDTVTATLTILRQVPSSSVPQKEIITLATQSLGYDIRSQLIAFNRSSDKYRIEVRDYSEYNNYNSDDEADYTAGLTKLKTEILSGNVPDLIDLNGLPMRQFAARGILEDLYPYIDSDPDFERGDFLQNVLAAYEVDGRLYETVSNFSVMTVIGSAAVVGDKPGWNVDQFKAALAQMPEGCTAFGPYTTRPEILQYCLYLDMDNFVDWNTGKVSFDNDGFVKLLEFAAAFPSEFDWESYYGEGYEWSEEDDETWRLVNGAQMLQAMGISEFSELQQPNAVFGGRATCVGFPTEFGVGNMFEAYGSQFAMTSKCSNKEAAWEFLRQFFTAEYQTNGRYVWGFPVNSKAFEQQMTEAMTPNWAVDENGKFILDENGERIDNNNWEYENYGIMMGRHTVTQEEADQIRELVAGTTKAMDFDQSIYDIVNEESAAYFAGQKSAQDVARLIQSKAMIYINEQR